MRDAVLVVAVALAFAWVLTAQVFIVAGLVRRRLYWKAVSSLVVPILAPYWAWGEGLRARSIAWVLGAVCYAAALAVALSSA